MVQIQSIILILQEKAILKNKYLQKLKVRRQVTALNLLLIGQTLQINQ